MEEEWAFVSPYLRLLPEDAGQRRHDLRAVFDARGHLLALSVTPATTDDRAKVGRAGTSAR